MAYKRVVQPISFSKAEEEVVSLLKDANAIITKPLSGLSLDNIEDKLRLGRFIFVDRDELKTILAGLVKSEKISQVDVMYYYCSGLLSVDYSGHACGSHNC